MNQRRQNFTETDSLGPLPQAYIDSEGFDEYIDYIEPSGAGSKTDQSGLYYADLQW